MTYILDALAAAAPFLIMGVVLAVMWAWVALHTSFRRARRVINEAPFGTHAWPAEDQFWQGLHNEMKRWEQ